MSTSAGVFIDGSTFHSNNSQTLQTISFDFSFKVEKKTINKRFRDPPLSLTLEEGKAVFPRHAVLWRCAWMVTCVEVGGCPPWVSRSLCLCLAGSPCNLYRNLIKHTLPESLNLHIYPRGGRIWTHDTMLWINKQTLVECTKGFSLFSSMMMNLHWMLNRWKCVLYHQ